MRKLSPVKDKDSKLWAFLGVLLPLIGFLLVLLVRKDDKYAKYYSSHGLIFLFLYLILQIFSFIPKIGGILTYIGIILLLIAWVMALVASLSEQEKRIPIVTEIKEFVRL